MKQIPLPATADSRILNKMDRMRYKQLEDNGERKNSSDSGKTDNLVRLCADLSVSRGSFKKHESAHVSLPVIAKNSGQVSPREPHGKSTHQNPENSQLIQHLAQETEGSMKINRSNSWRNESRDSIMNSCSTGID